jgi:uncharacterized protein (DUF2062 family)
MTVSSPTSNITTTTPVGLKNSSHLSGGAIAAIVICSIIAGALFAISGFLIYRYRQTIVNICRKKLKLDEEDEDENEDEEEEEKEVRNRTN